MYHPLLTAFQDLRTGT